VDSGVEAATLLAQLPLATVFALGMLAFVKGWVITAGRFGEMREDRDYWRATALRLMNVTEQVAQQGAGGDAVGGRLPGGRPGG
jgi:hypothetical protein